MAPRVDWRSGAIGRSRGLGLEAISGQMYLAVYIARRVGLLGPGGNVSWQRPAGATYRLIVGSNDPQCAVGWRV